LTSKTKNEYCSFWCNNKDDFNAGESNNKDDCSTYASTVDKTLAVFDGLTHSVIASLQKMAEASDPTVVRKLKLLNEDKALSEFASCNVFREMFREMFRES